MANGPLDADRTPKYPVRSGAHESPRYEREFSALRSEDREAVTPAASCVFALEVLAG